MKKLFFPIASLLDLIFPRECALCGKKSTLLCSECLGELPRADRTPHSFITALFEYRHPAIRTIIWKFKYKNMRMVAGYFGELLYEEIIGDMSEQLLISEKEKFLLVPIPLHPKRYLERGYNQSELLARAVLPYDTSEMFLLELKALLRTKATKAQAKSQKRTSRFENLRGAFTANPDLVQGKNIILIDDVTTTGATLSEARKVLLKAGAKDVRAYVVAH